MWKTLNYCEKDAKPIKDCIRRNEYVAITLYRDFAGTPAKQGRHGFDPPAAVVPYFQDRLSLHTLNE